MTVCVSVVPCVFVYLPCLRGGAHPFSLFNFRFGLLFVYFAVVLTSVCCCLGPWGVYTGGGSCVVVLELCVVISDMFFLPQFCLGHVCLCALRAS